MDNLGRVIILLPLSGTRQGDAPSAQIFAHAMTKLVQQWSRMNFNFSVSFLVGRDFWSGCSVFLGSVLFADDLLRCCCILDPKTVLARCELFNQTLKQVLNNANMDLNMDKFQMLVCWVESIKNAKQKMLLRPRFFPFCKKIKPIVKHLGFHHDDATLQQDVGAKPEVGFRIVAANRAWRSLWQLWISSFVSLDIKMRFYTALVISNLINGLAAFSFSSAQLSKIEIRNNKKLCVLLLGNARGLTSKEDRERCKCFSIESMLLRARIVLLQKLARDPAYHSATCAALFGSIKGLQKQIINGKPARHANPWLQQIWKDIHVVAKHCPES